MEKDLKKVEKLISYLIGRVLRLENKLGCSDVSDAMIYAILNDIEIDYFNLIPERKITTEKIRALVDVITPIYNDKNKLEKFTGYYDIEPELEQRGVHRSEAIVILTMLKNQGCFKELIKKMDSENSPVELRDLDIHL